MTNLIGISGKKSSGKDTVAKIIRILNSKIDASTTEVLNEYEEFEWIIDEHTDWEIRAFADKLKDMVCLLIGCTREQLEDSEFKEKPLGEEWKVITVIPQDGPTKKFRSKSEAENWIDSLSDPLEILDDPKEEILTPRKLLQELGTEVCRQIHSSMWINALFADYEPIGGKMINPKYPKDYTSGRFIFPKWIISDVRFPDEAQAIKYRGGIVIRVERPDVETSDKHKSETALDHYTNWDAIIDNKYSIEHLVKEVEAMLKQFKIIQ